MANGGPISDDLRSRVVAEILAGATRRQATERFKVSAAPAVRWAQLHSQTGGVQPRPRGGKSRSPLKPCGLAAGAYSRGTGSDAGSYCAAAIGRCWAENFGGCGSSLLQTPHHYLQKKSCTPPSRTGLTSLRRVSFGRPARRALTPPSWCSLTKPAPIPRWCAPTGDVGGASGSSARPRGDIGKPQPSPAACAATVWSPLGCWKAP